MCIISDLVTRTDRECVSSAAVTFAAKGYFDALVRMGELASESQGSKDLGKSLFVCPVSLGHKPENAQLDKPKTRRERLLRCLCLGRNVRSAEDELCSLENVCAR